MRLYRLTLLMLAAIAAAGCGSRSSQEPVSPVSAPGRNCAYLAGLKMRNLLRFFGLLFSSGLLLWLRFLHAANIRQPSPVRRLEWVLLPWPGCSRQRVLRPS